MTFLHTCQTAIQARELKEKATWNERGGQCLPQLTPSGSILSSLHASEINKKLIMWPVCNKWCIYRVYSTPSMGCSIQDTSGGCSYTNSFACAELPSSLPRYESKAWAFWGYFVCFPSTGRQSKQLVSRAPMDYDSRLPFQSHMQETKPSNSLYAQWCPLTPAADSIYKWSCAQIWL